MNWLDLALILFAVIFIIIGIKKGFMTSILTSFSIGGIAIAAFFLYKPIASLLNNWFGLEKAISASYYSKLTNSSPDFARNLIELEKSQLRPFVKSCLNSGAIPLIPKIMFSLFLNTRSLYSKLHNSGLESRNLGQIVSSTYANFFTTLIAFAITFALLILIILLFKFIVNKLRNNGAVKFVDNFLGAFYGFIRCFVVLVVVCLIIKLLSPFSFMKSITNYISGSFFGNLIYRQIHTILDHILGYTDIITSIFK